MTASQNDATLYVMLPDPAAVRKPLLEAARAAITTGRVGGKLHQLQDQKLATRGKLAGVLKDIQDELSRLQMILPHREVKETPTVSSAPQRKKVLDHRVDKIEAALAEIESRMKTL